MMDWAAHLVQAIWGHAIGEALLQEGQVAALGRLVQGMVDRLGTAGLLDCIGGDRVASIGGECAAGECRRPSHRLSKTPPHAL